MIKKAFYILTAVVAMCFTSCEKYDHAIADIEDRLDKIEGTSLTTIDQQIAAINGSIDDLKTVDTELKGYIEDLQNTANDLQSKIDAANTALAALESDLEGQITASEQKVLNELATVKAALESQLATINNTIATLTSQLTAIEDKITSLESAVAACATQEELDEVKRELATVQSEMATMKTAIENLQKRMTAVEGEVDSLQDQVKNLESKIAALEELFNQIQSVTFIPQYSDGKVKLDRNKRIITLDFMINPKRLSDDLVEAWEDRHEIIKAYVHYTDDPTTRAVAAPKTLEVTKVFDKEDGMIEIELRATDLTEVTEDFWLGKQEAVIYIVITNGVTEIASETIPMIAHSYADNTNTIGGYGDGGSQRGEVGK